MVHATSVRAVRWALSLLLVSAPVFGQGTQPESSANRIVREGMAVEFSARPVGRSGPLREGDDAEVAFRITDATTGRPLRSLAPGAWMDVGQPVAGHDQAPPQCRQKMNLYLSGRVGIRPMIDLNSYFVLTLNRDASISVVDPHVGMAGKTYLYAHVALPRPGADWTKTADDKRVFVTIPRSGEVAVVDAETFKASARVAVGGLPMSIVLQGDGRYLWVGDDSADSARSGVGVIDAATLAIAGRVPTGRGHHEIALSTDDRWAFVTNPEEGTVSVIDVQRLAKVTDVETGPRPISLAYSSSSQALYVADGTSGQIAVVDGRRREIAARIAAKPGLGLMRLTADGRWAFVVNGQESAVHIVDLSDNRLAHTVRVRGRPDHLALTRAFAYVRSLDSAQVSMIALSEVGREQPPAVTEFAAGTQPPGSAPRGIALAAPIVPATVESAVMAANPADGNVYFYMEGMVAPMATFRNYGHQPTALQVVNRTLKEREPGVYRTTVQLPVAGQYDVGFVLTSPGLVHCFVADVARNPTLARKGPALEIQYLIEERLVSAHRDAKVAFKLTDPATRQPRAGLHDVRVVYYLAPGRERVQAPVREVGDGVYEATVSIREAGAYYVHVAVPSARVEFADLPFLSLVGQTEARSVGRPTAK